MPSFQEAHNIMTKKSVAGAGNQTGPWPGNQAGEWAGEGGWDKK